MVRALKQRIEQTPTKPNCGERHARFVGLPDFGGQDLLVEYGIGHKKCCRPANARQQHCRSRICERPRFLCAGRSELLNSLLRHGVTSEVNGKFLEDFLVHFAKHYCTMHLTTTKLRQAFKGFLAVFIPKAEH